MSAPRPESEHGCVYTLGHSNHALEHFLALLRQHGIERVADVRSHPYSRFHPQYRRDALRAHLADAGMTYEFLGRELGARPDDPACYVEDKVDYERLARTAAFGAGLERVATLAARERVALLCAERDPLTCHRAILVARHLAPRGVDARHIHVDGRLESHAAALERLEIEVGLASADLFANEAERRARAYELRGRELAYGPKRRERQP